MTDDELKNNERCRLDSIVSREGTSRAVQFAQQTLGVYRTALAKNANGRRSGYGSAYRRPLVMSCIVLRAYLRDAGART